MTTCTPSVIFEGACVYPREREYVLKGLSMHYIPKAFPGQAPGELLRHKNWDFG